MNSVLATMAAVCGSGTAGISHRILLWRSVSFSRLKAVSPRWRGP